jgi:UDPglucose--hexose-1-phosphate uridylyltransferase
VATESVPFRLAEELEGFRRAASGSAECLLESVVAAETQAAERIVANTDTCVVLAPFASEHPYETWIVPHRHASSFGGASDAEIDQVAELLPAVLRALDATRPHASYNWFVHGLELPPGKERDLHWHIEVVPRLLRADGYELGAGTSVNPVLPETAAAELRNHLGK